MNDQWYFSMGDGKPHGPFEFDKMVELMTENPLTVGATVFHAEKTEGEWIDASRIKPLREQNPPVPPPVSSPQIVDAAKVERSAAPNLATDHISSPGKWKQIIPGNHGKKVILLTTLTWVVLLPVAFILGLVLCYGGEEKLGSGPNTTYLINDSFILTSGEMRARDLIRPFVIADLVGSLWRDRHGRNRLDGLLA